MLGARRIAAALAPFALWPISSAWDASLRNPARPTGWVVLCLVAALALFGARKRVPVVRLGSASSWLSMHLTLGWAVVVAFLFHAGGAPPRGILDLTLYWLFAVAAVSGIVGFAFELLLPVRLAVAGGDEIPFERIPAQRERLRREVEEEILACAGEGQGRALADFYQARLLPWFSGPSQLVEHWLDLERTQRALLIGLGALERYASPREREALDRIAARIEKKDALDFRHAQHLLLRSWLLVHVPVTWALIAAGALHATLAILFQGKP